MKKRNRNIEKALRQRFPGWSGKFWNDGKDWSIEADSGCKEEFYDLYPNMTKAQADKQIILDIMAVIQKFLPHAILEGYEQHDKYIRVNL